MKIEREKMSSSGSPFYLACIASLLALLAHGGFCLVEDDAKEQTCFPIRKTETVDANWFESTQTQYYPLMSLLDLYRSAQALRQSESREISPSTMFRDACIQFTFDPEGAFILQGFGGQKVNLDLKILSPGYERVEMALAHSGISATCYTTLTDNSTFVFVSCCHSDDQMSWAVVSSVPSLSVDKVKVIHAHATSLGFKRAYFAELRYTSCPGIELSKNGE